MAYGLVTEKSGRNFDVPAGEFSLKNFDVAANPNQTFCSMGNCSTAAATWNSSKITKYDGTRGTRQVVAEAEVQRGLGLAVTMDESDPIKYAMAVYGRASIVEIPETQITNEVFTVSPGEEIFLMIPGKDIAAYNYKDLKIQYLDAQPAYIHQPMLDTQAGVMPSAGIVKSSGTYTGVDRADYYVKIDTANTTAGNIAGMKYVWKKGLAGTYSAAIAVTTSTAQELSDGVKVAFSTAAAGQDFVRGDIFKISADPEGDVLIVGQDYNMDSVDVRNGKIRFPITSTIGFKSKIKVSCKIPQQFIPRVQAGVKKKIEGMLRFESDPTHGRQKSYTFYHVSFSPSGDESLVSEDWAGRQIQMTVLADYSRATPDNPDSVYYHIDYPGDTQGILLERD